MDYNPSFNVGSNLPMNQVSYLDVQEFLKKVNKNNFCFRLPTEAE